MIPKQLQKDELRFILTNKKIPIETGWQKTANYKYDDPKLLDHINKKGNVGCATGFGNVVVIDFDDENLQKKTIRLLPKTFTTMSGGGLLHKWFIVDKPESHKVLDGNMNTLCDIQGEGKQIIIPPSIHGNGKQYKVVDDSEITKINMSEIKALFSKYIKNKVNKIKREIKEKDRIIVEIKTKVTVPQFLSKNGIDTSKNPTECPLHNSKGGKCLSFKDDVWHCFHCEKGGDIFNLYQEIKQVGFLQAKYDLSSMAGIQAEKTGAIKIDTYMDNAHSFWQIQPFFFDENNLWWIWYENRWTITDEVEMKRKLDSALGFQGQTISSGLRNNHLEAMKWVGREKKPKKAKDHWIQFNDKVFSLTSKNIYDVTPDYFFTNPIPFDIGKTDETPFMDKLFEEWVGPDLSKDLYEILAYCCYRRYPIQIITCLYGHGRNGKSKYLNILSNFLGLENVCSTELDLIVGLSSSRFETSKLYKKLACLMGETNFGTLNKSSILKKMVGDEVMGFEMKGKNPFDDYNYSKVIIASNSLPTTEDTSEGYFRRWHIIPFTNEFPEGKDILEDLPMVEYNNLAKKVLTILPDLLKRGKFAHQGTIKERTDRYIMASNPLPYFIDKFCLKEEDQDVYVSYGELYIAYCQFLKHRKKRKVSMKEFRSSLEDEGFWIEKKTKNSESNRWIEGIKLRENWKINIYDEVVK